MEDSPEFQCPHADVLACHKSAHVGIGIQGCLPLNLITPRQGVSKISLWSKKGINERLAAVHTLLNVFGGF